MIEKLEMMSKDIIQENINYIADRFPNALKEVKEENGKSVKKIDFDILKQELSNIIIDDKQERYQMTWPDKKKSILLANSRINSTLRPVKEKSVDFDNTKNLYIEGDNLEVLKLLQETYLHKVDVIYIDPPYNTGRNYIYKNDYSIKANDFFKLDSQMDENGNRLTQNQETNGRFHTDWLNMMYTRLKVAKNLLSEDGVLVVAIDENELSTLAQILKEIFSENVYDLTYTTVVHNPRGQQGNNFSYVNEYALFVYKKDKKYIGNRKIPDDKVDWSPLRNWGSESERSDAKNCFYPIMVKDDKIIGFGDVCPYEFHPSAQTINVDGIFYIYPIDINGIERKWRYARQTVESIFDLLRVKKTRNGYDIEIGKNFETQKTLWDDSRYDASVYGSQLVQKLTNLKDGFSFPKSLWLVYDTLLAASNNKKDILVLDFFSGSATTAHAVMELNAKDFGHRRYIMIQIPQECDSKEEAKQKGYNTICDIAEERIRLAGKKIIYEIAANRKMDGLFAKEYNETELDIGFRVLKLDSSNLNDVFYNAKSTTQSLFDNIVDNVKSDRTPLDLLFQVMLELGIELSAKIKEINVAGKKCFIVNENDIVACFDNDITDEVVLELAKIKPVYAVFKDSSFATDSSNINCEQIFKSISASTAIKVI